MSHVIVVHVACSGWYDPTNRYPIEEQPAVSASSRTRTADANIYSEALMQLNFLASTYDQNFHINICKKRFCKESFELSQ